MQGPGEPEAIAAQLLEVVPSLAGVLRQLTMEHAPGELRLREWRWLFFVAQAEGQDLETLGEIYGREPEEVGPVIDRLLELGVLTRSTEEDGPIEGSLEVTDQGQRALGQARQAVADRLTDRIAAMGPGTLATVTEALDILEETLTAPDASGADMVDR